MRNSFVGKLSLDVSFFLNSGTTFSREVDMLDIRLYS